MTYEVTLVHRAQNEFVESVEWYRKRNRKAAEDFITNFTEAVNLVSSAPHRWPEYHKDFRDCLVKDYPFTIVYRVDELEKRVVIISVFHHSRHPKGKYGPES
jgi:plasmid stabilization system protein ParE